MLEFAAEQAWRLEAWAVFTNHYHFVGHSPQIEDSVRRLVTRLHERTAKHLKQTNVWHNYWESRLTYERSYYARLHYVHTNPVKHGLVHVASDYPFCSAGWFERTARRAVVRTIYSFKIDRIRVMDDFD
ncbi:MAG TPA: hypothetical protein PLF26_11180 [Blastocatellia bacterium]|nr:hypothetical protein [Blastocatellia bacterium]